MSDVQILILGAGASSRMRGGDKLLEPIAGEALLTRIARLACACERPVTLVMAPGFEARRAAVAGLPLRLVTAPDAAKGMAESLKAGLRALPATAPVLLMLADLPELTTADMQSLLAAHRETPELILRGASATGQAGHPTLLPGWLRPELANLHGDEGARALFHSHAARLRLIALPEDHAVTDLDTPEAWADWRASHPEAGSE